MPWPPEANSAFVSLKQGLASTPALGLPDYSKPFTLFCHEQSGCALGVLTQMHGEKNCPVAYFSATLDPVAQGLPPYLHGVAAAARLVEMSDSLVLRSSLTPWSLTDLTLLQDSAPETEKESWVAQGCSLHPDSFWRSPTSAFVAPFSLYPSLAALLHGVSHVGKEGMVSAVTKTGWWAPPF
ncbi:unnamed protein product [Caretta caretta]